MLGSLLRSPKVRQIGQIELNLSVDGASVTPAASGPDSAIVLSVTDVGVGIYTITLKESAKIALHVSSLVSLTDAKILKVHAVTVNSVTVKAFDAAGVAADADFNIQIKYADQLSYYF